MANGRPISENGIAVSVTLVWNRAPWVIVTTVASRMLKASTRKMRGMIEPRISRKSLSPLGRSRTIMPVTRSAGPRTVPGSDSSSHLACFEEAAVPAQGLVEQVGRVQARRALGGAVQVVLQLGPEAGVGAAFHDQFGALRGRQATQVGQALLGDDDLDIVLGVVHVRDHGHDAGDGAVLGHRGRDEEGQVGVARKVARAADAV